MVYVFDAQFEPLFNYVSSAASYLSAIGELNNMIIVGIYAENRRKEFVPIPETEKGHADWGSIKDHGFSYLLDKHLKEEVFPFIEKNFNINSFKIGIGHSLGGTYLINSFAEDHKLFNAYIAISPNLDFENNQIQNKVKNLLNVKKEVNAFLNVSVGDLDETELRFKKGIQLLDTIITNTKTNGLKFRFDYLKNANHSTSSFFQIPLALAELGKTFVKPSDEEIVKMLNNKKQDFMVQLKNYYIEKSKWFGYTYLPKENVINGIAYVCFNNNSPIESLETINWAIELYPNEINLYDSKAEFLKKLKQNVEANKVVKFALKKLEILKLEKDEYIYFKEMLENKLKKK